MTDATKLLAGILLISVPTIEYGGTFLLSILSGKHAELTEFQRSMFRAGHAHAGVLIILALIALLFTDQARLSAPVAWAVRIGFAAAPRRAPAMIVRARRIDPRRRGGKRVCIERDRRAQRP